MIIGLFGTPADPDDARLADYFEDGLLGDELDALAAMVDDPPYDNFADLDMCDDCRGSGWYVGVSVREPCQKCDGSGWVAQGDGWDRDAAERHGVCP